MRNFISQKALEDALLFELFDHSQDRDEPIEAEGLRQRLPVAVSKTRTDMAMIELQNQSLVHYETSEYELNGYSILRRGYMQVEKGLSEPSDFFAKYARDKEETLSLSTLNVIPASDRIVTRSDNLPAIKEIESRLKDLESEIKKSNSVEETLDEPKGAVLAEIDAGEALVAGESFRLSKLIGLILPLLRKLADKFSSGAIGKLAGELIEALLKLI
ncbi:hypothetical protein [Aurantiacibacter marinus]|uniref:Uncharacterized protein n=1 Tax=Aurantiacibacter marinus TaxID=874156 RepID=A0A0H0XPB3_9SPHN|nr:hypothetical protein [Aurantiacibacter marinus]KLI63821.1 hypothetical protein AAV99_08930 [Aurantiacibacter marinus]